MSKDWKIIEIERYQLVEVKITNTISSRFNLPDVNNLRGKKIVGIEVYNENTIPYAPSGRVVAPWDVYRNSYLTLVDCESNQGISEVPFETLDIGFFSGGVKYFNELILDISSCFIALSDTTVLALNSSWILGFYYKDI